MKKIQAVVLDITKDGLQWLDENADECHLEICEVLSLDKDSPIPVWDLPLYDNWDVLLVFERGFKEKIESILEKAMVSKDKVIYVYDTLGSLYENFSVSTYIFGTRVRRILNYVYHRYEKNRYSIMTVGDISYANVSTDNVILPYMIDKGCNWAEDEINLMYRLSCDCFEFSESQDIFCDIGANIGTTCIYFKKKLDKKIKILAFEPSAENYKLLKVNLALNGIDFSEQYIEPMGLSDVSSKAILSYNLGNPGASSLVSENGEEVQLITFDDYIEKSGIDPGRIKYFWVDVEGHEARFLKGASRTFDKIRVPVFIEFVPYFYMNKEGEFELLMNEISKHFTCFICAQEMEKGKQNIEVLWEKQNDMTLSWDLFLMNG